MKGVARIRSVALLLADLPGRLRVLRLARRSTYRFSPSDYWLYLRYGGWPGPGRRFPAIEIMERGGEYVDLQVGGRSYRWPAEAARNGLDWIYQEVFVPASRNSHAYEFAGATIEGGDNVVDAGAGEGFFVEYALQRGARVLALEPVESLARALEHTFAAEIDEGRVRVLPVAVGAVSGRGHLDVAQGRLFESRVAGSGVEIQTVSLDDIAGQKRVDFVKMDIEGAEMDAVQGAAGTIARDKPRLAIAVYHEQDNAHSVCELLRRIRPDYEIRHRGIYAWAGCEPRPVMVYAW